MWIENSEVENALKSQDFDVFNSRGILFCNSSDYKYCIFIRTHSAWKVSKTGWRDANSSPEEGELGRGMINFAKIQKDDEPGFWFKTFIPLSVEPNLLKCSGNNEYELHATNDIYRANFKDVPSLMWKLMTGSEQSEEDIKERFSVIWNAT